MMRVANFVDAGYLYAEGSKSLSSSGAPLSRIALALNIGEAVAKLRKTSSEKTEGAPLLRIYWYDGVRGELSLEQRELAVTPDVKFRAGVVNQSGQQKGVDSLIVTDLIELARNQAISDAVLLSGDGDLRIGVQIAQSFGVRVHLVSIEPSGGHQSRSSLLWQEADTATVWSSDDIRGILSTKPGFESEYAGSVSATATTEISNETADTLDGAIVEFIEELTSSQIAETKNITLDWIPPALDRPLRASCRTKIGRDLNPSEMNYVRNQFRQRTAGNVRDY